MKVKINKSQLYQIIRQSVLLLQAEGLTKQYLLKLAQNDQRKVKQAKRQRRQQFINHGFLQLVNNNQNSSVFQSLVAYSTRQKLQNKKLDDRDFNFLHDLIIDNKARMFIQKKLKQPNYNIQQLKRDRQRYKTDKEEQKRGGLSPQEHKQYSNVKVIRQFANGRVWVQPLDAKGKQKRACRITGKVAGHCGNRPGESLGGNIFVLRDKQGVKTHVTVVVNTQGLIRQRKGNHNMKANRREYKQQMYWFLSQPFVKGFDERGRYAPQRNFHVSDLAGVIDDNRFEQLVKRKPGLITDYDQAMMKYRKQNLSNDQIFQLLMNDKITLRQRLGLGL